jgi:hypothetical protein
VLFVLRQLPEMRANGSVVVESTAVPTPAAPVLDADVDADGGDD